MIAKRIELIIKEIYYGWAGENVDTYDFEIDKATQAILAEFERMLPEEKKLHKEALTHWQENENASRIGHNNCLKKIRERIKKL